MDRKVLMFVVVAIWTGLSRDLNEEGEAAIRATSPFWKTHDQGASTVLVAALDPVLSGELLLCVESMCMLMFG